MLLSLTRSHLFNFYFHCSGRRNEKGIVWFMSKSVLPMFSSKSFIVLGLTFRSWIHFELIFVYGVEECSNLILLHIAVQFSQHSLLKRMSFPQCYGIWRQGFWEVTGFGWCHGVEPHDGISAFKGGWRDQSLLSAPHMRIHGSLQIRKNVDLLLTWSHNSQHSELWEIPVCCISYPAYGNLLYQLKHTLNLYPRNVNHLHHLQLFFWTSAWVWWHWLRRVERRKRQFHNLALYQDAVCDTQDSSWWGSLRGKALWPL